MLFIISLVFFNKMKIFTSNKLLRVKNDHCSKSFNLSNWKEEAWKKNQGFNGKSWFFFFFRLLLSNCLNWKIYCDDHSSLSSTTAVQKWIISYTSHQINYYFVAWLGQPSGLTCSWAATRLGDSFFYFFCLFLEGHLIGYQLCPPPLPPW